MSTLPAESPASDLRIVDLDLVSASELDGFFRQEIDLWRDRLLWDVSGAITAFRRALERGGVLGKAIREGSSTVGYGYFLVEGSRGVITGLSFAPAWRGYQAASLLSRAIVEDLSQRGARRIESQFVSFDAPWLVPCFETLGFRTYWREFRRLALARPRSRGAVGKSTGSLAIASWKSWDLSEACQVMQRAHLGGVDAEMNELYRTPEGCRSLLTNVLRHRGCGNAVADVSVTARHRDPDRAVGFAVVTETAARHAHLAQLAVTPFYQHAGVGRRLLAEVIERLLARKFGTISLMVSRGNDRAIRLYRQIGFDLVFRFPVFCREE